MNSRPRPLVLCILDGWGERPKADDNAIEIARVPNWHQLKARWPHAQLQASEHYVGLPEGQMGNSEVGHTNIGAGRLVLQDLPRIDAAIAEGKLASMPALRDFIGKLKTSRGTAHLIGLMSPGGVHSHQRQIAALARILAEAGVPVAVHAFLDGRDTPPKAAVSYVKQFQADVAGLRDLRITTICGRYYAMDRDKRWDRVEKAYDAIVEADGPHFADAPAVVADAYANKKFDEFILPAVVGDYKGMKDGDGILCFNFRADRVREILGAMLEPDFKGFDRKRVVKFATAVGMTQYSDQLDRLMATIFPPQTFANILGEVVAHAGRTQLRMAETEKYPHVTYFLNGGREEPYSGEERIMVPSPKVATYDLQPEMSAPELTDKAVAAINSGKYDLIVLNFANPDMVGHTGSLPAAIKAVETVDAGLGRIVDAIDKAGGALLVTADHGNCEMMRDPATGGPHTAHTTNPVPLLLFGGRNRGLVAEGRLADLAPTLLELMELPKPKEMTGASLLAG
jgi:2,3-bisphosphoglycerate-independent phosphoglycerate mutase